MKQLLYGMVLAAQCGLNAAAQPANRLDSMAQRTAACIACHGAEGRASAEGFLPRIAGKPQGYLYKQLLHFRQGRRVNPAMQAMVAQLPDAYLVEIAGYFAAQEVPYPAPQKSAATLAQLERGRRIASEGLGTNKGVACVACHGQQLGGVAPAIPGLLGLPRDYITLQLSAWRQGSRRAAAPDCMAHVAGELAPSDVVAVAAWLSAQPVPAGYKPAAALPAPLPARCGGVQ